VRCRSPPLRGSPSRARRHHGMGPGQQAARRYLDHRTRPDGQLLHRALVSLARPRHRAAHGRGDPSRPVMSELVTVVVPARNEEANLGPCLSSILEQDWPNLQVLVVDGASTDGTGAIVESFARRDPRAEPHVNHDRSSPRSLNLAPRPPPRPWLVRAYP